MKRKRRRNPGGAPSFVLTVAAGVVTSLVTVLVLEALRKAREVATRHAEIAPGHGSA